MSENTKAPRKPRAPKAAAPKRVTALQRARLKATAATVPQYRVRGRLARALLSSPSPLAVALAMSSPNEARRIVRDLEYALHPFRKRSFHIA